MRKTEDSLDYVQKSISFRSIQHEPVSADCILCNAFQDATVKESKSVNLYITRSYNNEYSAIVLKEEDKGIFMYNYFKSIPILMLHSHGEMDFGELFSNFEPKNRILGKWILFHGATFIRFS